MDLPKPHHARRSWERISGIMHDQSGAHMCRYAWQRGIYLRSDMPDQVFMWASAQDAKSVKGMSVTFLALLILASASGPKYVYSVK